MFKILHKTITTRTATVPYPAAEPVISEQFRGRPDFDFRAWQDARPAAAVCPTRAISTREDDGGRQVTIDLGLCIFCGQCADVSQDGAVSMTRDFELATRYRSALIATADYAINPDGTQQFLRSSHSVGADLGRAIEKTFGRSLAIREVDAGSCNGCEQEIVALNNPVHDIERFGIHFVASPRHADMLLVTGPVTRNMEMALRKTYAAMPEPKLVVAVGACGISGGIFGENYATVGSVDRVLPVDVYIPGCPPRPEALLHGILLAVGRVSERGATP